MWGSFQGNFCSELIYKAPEAQIYPLYHEYFGNKTEGVANVLPFLLYGEHLIGLSLFMNRDA